MTEHWMTHLNRRYASTSLIASLTPCAPVGHRIFFNANCRYSISALDFSIPTSSKTVSEHTPLCSSCARYTNEKPPSPSTFIIWTINIIEIHISKNNLYMPITNLHVRPLILTAGVCWHKHEDNAQMASFAWSRKFSNARKSCGGSAMSLTEFYRRGRIMAAVTVLFKAVWVV